jgi:hypothetical protein
MEPSYLIGFKLGHLLVVTNAVSNHHPSELINFRNPWNMRWEKMGF